MSSSAPPRPRTPPRPPSEIAPHFPELEIQALIGQGGMGVVYRARQTKLDRAVALKVLHPDLSSDPAFAERFVREAKALALLQHVNIVAVYDFGERDGLYFLLMELVDGASLRQLIKTREIEPRHALTIVREVCDALQYAHDEGIVHRDIKPENVLLDTKGRVKIADFGLAKLVGAAASDLTLTAPGQVMGTPHYMAPEQMEHPRDVDHRADIYSLGVVFYEMLTGSLPLGRFEPPSQRVQVDVRLDEIVLRALEREPARRYQHAVDVKTDVTVVTDGAPRTGSAPSADSASGPDRVRGEDEFDRLPERLVGVVIGGVDTSRGFWPLAIFVPTWLIVAWLFNFGWLGTIGGGLLVLIVAYGILDAWIRRTPELSLALAAESGTKQTVRVAAAFVLAALGFAGVLLAHLSSWERGTSDYEPPAGALYLASHEDGRWEDYERAVGRSTPAGISIASGPYDRWDEDDLLFRTPPAVYAVAAALAGLAAALCLTWSKAGGLSSGASWRPALGIGAQAAVALVCLHAVTVAIDAVAPARRSQERRTNDYRGTIAEVSHAIRIALASRGYSVHVEWPSTLSHEGSDSRLFVSQIDRLAAQVRSPFDRWKVGWHGARRTTPHLLFELDQDWIGKTINARIDMGWAAEDARRSAEWNDLVVGISRELRNR